MLLFVHILANIYSLSFLVYYRSCPRGCEAVSGCDVGLHFPVG